MKGSGAILAVALALAAGGAPAQQAREYGVVIERASGSVQIVENRSRASLGRIEGLGDLSHASLVYSHDGRFAYVFGRDGGLTRIDVHERRAVAQQQAQVLHDDRGERRHSYGPSSVPQRASGESHERVVQARPLHVKFEHAPPRPGALEHARRDLEVVDRDARKEAGGHRVELGRQRQQLRRVRIKRWRHQCRRRGIGLGHRHRGQFFRRR